MKRSSRGGLGTRLRIFFYLISCMMLLNESYLGPQIKSNMLIKTVAADSLNPTFIPRQRVPQTQSEIRLHNQKIKKQRREKAIAEWKKQREKSSVRKEKQLCDAEGSCYPVGVFGVFRNGHGLTFCRDCSDSFSHGAFIDAWDCHYGPQEYEIYGEIVFAVPNYGDAQLLNPVKDNIVLVYRGHVPFYTKILNAQRAGAAAVLIIDDGSCTEDFDCGLWLGNRGNGKLAVYDTSAEWSGVFIPSALVTKGQSKRLISLLDKGYINFGKDKHLFVREPE